MLNKTEKKRYRQDTFQNLAGRPYTNLISSLVERHQPIDQHLFFSAWTWLQRWDSDIAEEIMLEMVSQDVPCLPLHDSFIVPAGDQFYLKRSMNQIYLNKVENDPSIDRKMTEGEYRVSVR